MLEIVFSILVFSEGANTLSSFLTRLCCTSHPPSISLKPYENQSLISPRKPFAEGTNNAPSFLGLTTVLLHVALFYVVSIDIVGFGLRSKILSPTLFC